MNKQLNCLISGENLWFEPNASGQEHYRRNGEIIFRYLLHFCGRKVTRERIWEERFGGVGVREGGLLRMVGEIYAGK